MKKKLLNELKQQCESCCDCVLHKTRNNVVFCDGNPETATTILIGEAPGQNEDLSGTPFVGRAGKLLNEFLSDAKINRENDLYIINTVKCRPPENRVPTDFEKKQCSKFLHKQINIIKPKVLIFCGATALKSFYDSKNIKISNIRGQWLDVEVEGQKYKAMAIFHPSYLLRNHSLAEGSPRNLMNKDLQAIKAYLDLK